MRANCGCKSPTISMRTHHHPAIISLPAKTNKSEHAEATGDYFWPFFFSPLFFLKGRSRVWLMSRQNWTEWLANKTPWFQLTTYHRRRTKREGNKTSFIVYCFITLGKIDVHVSIKMKKKKRPLSPTPVPVSAHQIRFRCYRKSQKDWKIVIWEVEILMRL